MRRKALILMVILIIISIIFIMEPFKKEYKITKITDSSKIPKNVKSELANTNLERGVYYFTEFFSNNKAYLVFCGGKGFEDGYNVDIVDLEYSSLIEEVSGPPKKPIYGFYKLDYKESKSDERIKYGITSEYPIVIFEVSGKIGMQAWPVLTLDNDLKIIKWWGLNETYMENEWVKSEIIETNGDHVPALFLRYFNEDINLQSVEGKIIDDTEYYVYKVNSDSPFSLSIESLATFRTQNNKYPYDLVVHKKTIKEPYYADLDNYYIILKTTVKKDFGMVYPRKYLILDDQLGWRLSR